MQHTEAVEQWISRCSLWRPTSSRIGAQASVTAVHVVPFQRVQDAADCKEKGDVKGKGNCKGKGMCICTSRETHHAACMKFSAVFAGELLHDDDMFYVYISARVVHVEDIV